MRLPFKLPTLERRGRDGRPSFLSTKQFGVNALLAGSAVIMLLAVIDLAGVVWREFRPLRGVGITFATFVGPAFFWVGLRDSLRSGLNWKYVASCVCSLVTVAVIGLAVHELLSVTPLLRKF